MTRELLTAILGISKITAFELRRIKNEKQGAFLELKNSAVGFGYDPGFSSDGYEYSYEEANMKRRKTGIAISLLIGSLFLLFGCGGGGNGTTPFVTAGTISGAAIKGPVNNGAVTAFAVNNGIKSNQLASATTDTLGNFSMSIGSYSGPLMLELSGGSYTDEATGAVMTMGASDVITAVVPSIPGSGSVTGIKMTPLTSMAQTMASNMAGGMTTTNSTAANTAVGNYFVVSDILHTQPMDPLTPGSGAGANQDMRNYGMAIAAMSEQARSLGMPNSSGMVTAMMNDASDGVMNGMMGGTPVSMNGMGGMMGGGNMQATAGTSGLASAMTTFMMNTAVNRSGLTVADMQALINKLNTSNGTVQ